MDRVKVASELVRLAKSLVAQTAMRENDIRENARFYDPSRRQEGTLEMRKYHQTTVWMMLYDDGTIEELTNSDLRRIKKV